MEQAKKETNYEHYADQIMDIIALYYGVDMASNRIMLCSEMKCSDCLFYNGRGHGYCNMNKPLDMKKWLNKEYKGPKDSVDWSTVAVDTPVVVWNTKNCPVFAYFAKYEDSLIHVWRDGKTSLTVRNLTSCLRETSSYRHGRLMTKEELK